MSIFEHVTKSGPKNDANEPKIKQPKSLFEVVTARTRKIQVSDEVSTVVVSEAQRIAAAEKLKARILNETAPGTTPTQGLEQPKPLQKIVVEHVDKKFHIMLEGQKDVLLICNSEEEAVNEGKACAERLGAVWCGIKKTEVKEEPKKADIKEDVNYTPPTQPAQDQDEPSKDEMFDKIEAYLRALKAGGLKKLYDKFEIDTENRTISVHDLSNIAWNDDDLTDYLYGLAVGTIDVRESNIPDDEIYRNLTFEVGEKVEVSATGEQAVTKGGKQWNEAEIKAISADKKSVQLYIPATKETRWINRFARPIRKLAHVDKDGEIAKAIGAKPVNEDDHSYINAHEDWENGVLEEFEHKEPITFKEFSNKEDAIEVTEDGTVVVHVGGAYLPRPNRLLVFKGYDTWADYVKDNNIEESKVVLKGGAVGEPTNRKPKEFGTHEEAVAYAKRMNAILSKGEKGYYKLKYVVEESKVNEMIDNFEDYKKATYSDAQFMHRFNNEVESGKFSGTFDEWSKMMWKKQLTPNKPPERFGTKESRVNEDGMGVPGVQGVKEDEDAPTSKDPPPRQPADPSEETPKAAPVEAAPTEELAKEYVGSSSGSPDTVHYYMVKTDDGDLQLVNQEGEKKYSAKENNLDTNDRRAFIDSVIQNADMDDVTRAIVLKYVVPEKQAPAPVEKPEEETDDKSKAEKPEKKSSGAGTVDRPELKAIEGEAEKEMKGAKESKVNEDHDEDVQKRVDTTFVYKNTVTGEWEVGGDDGEESFKLAGPFKDDKEAVAEAKRQAKIWDAKYDGIQESKKINELTIERDYKKFIEKKKKEFGEKFKEEGLSKKFIPYFESGAIIKVRFKDGEVKTGVVNATTGPEPVFILMLTSRSLGSSYLLSDEDEILGVNESKVLIEMKVDDGTNEFDVTLFDTGTDETAIIINGRQFTFSKDFAAMWRTADGGLTEEGLRELALEALTTMEGDEYEELVKSPESPDVRELHTKEKPELYNPHLAPAEEVDDGTKVNEGYAGKLVYTVKPDDVNKKFSDLQVKPIITGLGYVLKTDVGKQIFDINGVYQMENQEQLNIRTKRTYHSDQLGKVTIPENEAMVNEKIRCNNCMKEFDNDEATPMITVGGETFHGCPDCKTDEYLMDIKDVPNNADESKAQHRGKVVFSAERSKDKKEHFPINNAAQARNALARSHQYKSAPSWYSGSLSSLQNSVRRAVKKEYPSIEVKESVNEADITELGGLSLDDFNEFLKKYKVTKEQIDKLPWEMWNKLDDALFDDDLKAQEEIANLAKQQKESVNECFETGKSYTVEEFAQHGYKIEYKEDKILAVKEEGIGGKALKVAPTNEKDRFVVMGGAFESKVNESKRQFIDPSRGMDLLKKLLKR